MFQSWTCAKGRLFRVTAKWRHESSFPDLSEMLRRNGSVIVGRLNRIEFFPNPLRTRTHRKTLASQLIPAEFMQNRIEEDHHFQQSRMLVNRALKFID